MHYFFKDFCRPLDIQTGENCKTFLFVCERVVFIEANDRRTLTTRRNGRQNGYRLSTN